ncbi:MAG: gamma-glutamyltransferase [Candidatus Binatia bacterium]|nr:gamma-glutamyltransferase [Candidatus Binatia bacterium]
MVCTSQPLASQAGLAVLRAGGNAIDAAVTAAAVQGVVEPYSTGIGGDCFALVWSARDQRLFALNGSGRAPAGVSPEDLRAAGSEMPRQGIHTVTVPGAVGAWCALLEKFGSRSLGDALAPAIQLAEDGFAVSEVISHEWNLTAQFGFLQNDAARRCFAPRGTGPAVGQVMHFPDLARSLRLLADGGGRVFYEGELSDRLLKALRAEGGSFSRSDFADARPTWVEPIGVDYRGYRLCEIPPNTQGITALISLGILEQFEIGALECGSADAVHLTIEAVKLAFADRNAHIADPDHMAASVEALLDPASLRALAGRIDPSRAAADVVARPPAGSDTVYLTAADGEGNVVSFINSLYGAFGSGLVAGDTGIVLQNRGAGFSLDPDHPNILAGGKRPFHTLCPAMLLQNGKPRVSFGVMGGEVQAQGQVQVVSNLVDHGLNVQEALDAPRFHFLGAADVALEPEFATDVAAGLAERGHELKDAVHALVRGGFGGGQAIAIHPDTGVLWAGSDRRKDGAAAGF